MALQQQEYYTTTSRGALPRLQPAEGPGSVVIVPFNAGTAKLRNAGLAVYMELATGVVDILDGAGTVGTEDATLFGILLHPVNSHASDDVLCSVMIRGEAHYDDVWAAATPTEYGSDAAQFREILRNAAVRNAGLHISGLDALGSNLGT